MDATLQTEPAVFPAFQFAGQWRAYQARVLGELESHLDDARLNIVAAPGAGKTVLGLEVLRRLGRPTLILSPTRAIRDQWVMRLRELFEPEAAVWPPGLGIDVAAPGWLTSTTYQSLHTTLRGLLDGDTGGEEGDAEDEQDEIDDEESADSARLAGEALLEILERAGIETLVLDEAHHLRRAWWESLQEVIGYLKARRPDFHIVSLTATPPYDVEQEEWDRYAEVCGPVDAEISIPELVKQGDLCPHQDFLHFSVAQGEPIDSLEAFAREADALAWEWAHDETLLTWITAFAWFVEPEKFEPEILAKPAVFCGLLAIMKLNGREIPEIAPAILGISEPEIPEPRAQVLEALFQEILNGDGQFDCGPLTERLRRELQSIGALWRGRVRLRKQQQLVRALAGTAGKLDSIEAIAKAELAALGDRLRLVVLTDFIRSSALSRPADRSSDTLGAGPVLRRLGQAGLAPALRPALMTGSWVVIPDDVIPAFRSEAAKQGLSEAALTLKPLQHVPGWSKVDASAGKAALRLRVITHLFEEGHLRCLVGTAALLGEGWDAPSINSLILATSVKSFMLSNQMRGRAIRVSKKDPDKVAAIWHLATILPPFTTLATSQSSLWEALNFTRQENAAQGRLDRDPFSLGQDAWAVFRRFKTFAGVSHSELPVIESGIARLGIATARWNEQTASDWNRTMAARAADRPHVARAWASVFLGSSGIERPATGAVLPQPQGHKGIVQFGSSWLLVGLIGLVIQILAYSLHFLEVGLKTWLVIVGAALLLACAYHGGAIMRSIRAGSPLRYMAEIGRCLLDGLSVADILDTPRKSLDVRVEEESVLGQKFCRLAGGLHHDEVAFADAMVVFFAPIENPRHILVRHHRSGWLKQTDYHAVPDVISANEFALAKLKRAWERRIGPCEIINTRTRDGRLHLLRARLLSYSAGYRRDAERKLRWE
ncbi:DEAD/DEAH box helicase family protein [Pelagibius litoralis]|uniref:DEAD/DEAH box helicase family protein n=1 Tax=Pelagibius litoralis TaxID=374515 RepID=A0A967KFW5_9PROT|nr:DEAD/DEAH box helicase family protein [Pelagibius litoralis]NIA69871.1 DEAD/DEAH box helicase family protein [Pelagibius litoralis]